MEKKLPEDNLERFLRSSFEKFGESPSPKVWDRIEAGLVGHPAVVSRRMPGFVWIAAAGLVAIMGIAVFMLVRSNRELKAELKEVQTQVEKNEIKDLNEEETKKGQNEKAVEELVKENEGKGDEGNQLNEANDAHKVDNPLTDANRWTESKNKNSLPVDEKAGSFPGRPVKGNAAGYRESRMKQVPKILPADKKADDVIIAPEKEAVAINALDQEERESTFIERVQISSKNLNQIAFSALLSESKSILPALVRSPISVAASGARGRSMLIITGGLLSEKGKVKPLRPFDPRDAELAKNTYRSLNSWQAGLELERTLGRSFSITGGMNFKHFEFVHEINHTLAFRNREQHTPGRPPHHHDFRYRMDGPTGESEFEINSEQLDSRATIDDSEMIKVNIMNRSALNYLSIPIAAGYHFHLGRWQAFAKAGIQSDFLIGRSVDAPVVRISHPQLALKNNKPPVSTKPIHSIGFNGLLQAGVQYRLASQWGLRLNPSWLIPLTRRDPHIQSNAQAFSFQAGLTYTFASL